MPQDQPPETSENGEYYPEPYEIAKFALSLENNLIDNLEDDTDPFEQFISVQVNFGHLLALCNWALMAYESLEEMTVEDLEQIVEAEQSYNLPQVRH